MLGLAADLLAHPVAAVVALEAMTCGAIVLGLLPPSWLQPRVTHTGPAGGALDAVLRALTLLAPARLRSWLPGLKALWALASAAADDASVLVLTAVLVRLSAPGEKPILVER